MSRFRRAAHLASWARLCPGMNESGGKRRNASIGGGNLWVRSTLVEVALASVRSRRRKPNFFSARYHRLAARRGGKRPAIAVAHSILIAIYRMLKDGTLSLISAQRTSTTSVARQSHYAASNGWRSSASR
jgi:transposase